MIVINLFYFQLTRPNPRRRFLSLKGYIFCLGYMVIQIDVFVDDAYC